MPNQPKTSARTVRIPADLWAAVIARAEEDGTTATAVMLNALRQFLRP